ncbi:hypothetical protein [Halobacillus sp. Marseille-Q1614]|uniref:hypothetical protein n=1 Tax=Halobacillus sp. Marseille-Q1614 TaxID=2709134 RepID=UPI00157009F3|nr:hypothetical protein [Halobacillus sp. Marseille-Q1614]
MKTYFVLFLVVLFMHTMTLVNVTVYDGELNGIVLWLSTVLFLIAVISFATEHRANKRTRG